jgi:porin
VSKKHPLFLIVIIFLSMNVLRCRLFAEQPADASGPNEIAANDKKETSDVEPPEQPKKQEAVEEKSKEDKEKVSGQDSAAEKAPDKPAVSKESSDIEELLAESKETVDPAVIRKQKQKKEAKATAKPPKEEKEKTSNQDSVAEEDPNQPAVSRESTDIEELLAESQEITEEVLEDNEKDTKKASDQGSAAEKDSKKPAVSKESTDIEDLVKESKETVDQEVIRKQKQKKEAKVSAETAKEKEEAAVPKVDPPKEKKEIIAPGDDEEKQSTVGEKTEPSEVKAVADSNDIAAVQQDSTDVQELIEEVKRPVQQWFKDEYVQELLFPYFEFKQHLYEKHRFSLATEQVVIYQQATGGRRPKEQSVYNLTVFGLWELSKDNPGENGVMGFLFEERDNITQHSVEDFSQEVGSTFRTHTLNSNERSRTAFRQLWWRKKFADDTATLTIGKIHHPSYYNRNAYAGNSKTHFLAAPFARNPNRLLPQDGLGANVKITPNDDYYLSFGFGDAKSKLTTSGFDTIQDGDLMTMAEIGFTPGDGNYRFTIWHTDETEIDGNTLEEGSGFAFSFDHELYEKIGIFGRYGYVEPEVEPMRNFASTGFVMQDPWGLKGDLFGCGVSWDENYDTDSEEYSFEVFHRMQATKMLQITPSVLVVFEPTRSEKTEPVAVFGIRARLLF